MVQAVDLPHLGVWRSFRHPLCPSARTAAPPARLRRCRATTGTLRFPRLSGNSPRTKASTEAPAFTPPTLLRGPKGVGETPRNRRRAASAPNSAQASSRRRRAVRSARRPRARHSIEARMRRHGSRRRQRRITATSTWTPHADESHSRTGPPFGWPQSAIDLIPSSKGRVEICLRNDLNPVLGGYPRVFDRPRVGAEAGEPLGGKRLGTGDSPQGASHALSDHAGCSRQEADREVTVRGDSAAQT